MVRMLALCFGLTPRLLLSSPDALLTAGTLRLWHSTTFRLEHPLNYGFERAWCLAYKRGSNDIAVGFDEGAIVLRVCALLTSVEP